jgi:hypothetical protein
MKWFGDLDSVNIEKRNPGGRQSSGATNTTN